jgi:hypothetical protein
MESEIKSWEIIGNILDVKSTFFDHKQIYRIINILLMKRVFS